MTKFQPKNVTADAFNSTKTGRIEIFANDQQDLLKKLREYRRVAHIKKLNEYSEAMNKIEYRMPEVSPILHPHYWTALNYKTVLDPETGWYVYPWDITPTYRSIKHIGRGNCSQEAI